MRQTWKFCAYYPHTHRDMSRYELRIHIKKKAIEAAIIELQNIKATKSKMDGIEYVGLFDLQEYLQSPLFSRDEASLLLALRTCTVRGIHSDYGQMFPDKTCPLEGCSAPDSLEHILVCRVLEPAEQTSTVEFRDVFSSEVQLQWEATLHYSRLLKERERLLGEVATTGAQ